MATTSIWSVKGYLGDVVVYVENPDKTENPKAFEKANMDEQQTQGLSDVIDYAVQTKKTSIKTDDETTPIMKNFVSGINCTPSTARDEMMAAKIRFGKDTGVAAYHGYQSFVEGEVTPEQAHEIGVKLAEILWGEKYQVIVATHLDKGNHLHNHVVVNTVSFIDGIGKNKAFLLRNMRKTILFLSLSRATSTPVRTAQSVSIITLKSCMTSHRPPQRKKYSPQSTVMSGFC